MKQSAVEQATQREEETEQRQTDRAHKRRCKKLRGMRRKQVVPNVNHTVPNIKVTPQ